MNRRSIKLFLVIILIGGISTLMSIDDSETLLAVIEKEEILPVDDEVIKNENQIALNEERILVEDSAIELVKKEIIYDEEELWEILREDYYVYNKEGNVEENTKSVQLSIGEIEESCLNKVDIDIQEGIINKKLILAEEIEKIKKNSRELADIGTAISVVEEVEHLIEVDFPIEENLIPEMGYSDIAYYMSDLEAMILTKLNEERVKNALPALSYNNNMEHYARLKSKDMSERRYFSHENPEGELITKQMEEDGLGYISWGENIGYSESIMEPSILANQFIVNWMNSPKHRANILSSNFSSVGIGVYKSGNTVYVTQQFYK